MGFDYITIYIDKQELLEKLYVMSYKIKSDDNADNQELRERIKRTIMFASSEGIDIGSFNKSLSATEINSLAAVKLNIPAGTPPENYPNMFNNVA
jgi:hypothetical protein